MKQIAGAIVMVAGAICVHGAAVSVGGRDGGFIGIFGAVAFGWISLKLLSDWKKEAPKEPEELHR